MRATAHLAVTLLALGFVPRVWALEPDKPGVAVMEFTSNGGVTQQQMDSLADLLANQIRALGRYTVLGKGDVRAVLNFQEQKTLAGCSEDSCLAELGGALGVRWIVAGNVSQFGETFLLNLKLLDVKAVQVVKGLSKKVKGGQDELLDALEGAVEELFAALAEGPAAPPAAEPAVEARAEAPAAPMDAATLWGHVTTWSGAALLVLGGVGTYLSWDAGQDWKDASLPSAERLDARAESQTWAGVMWAGYGVGAALVLTGVLLWTLGPDAPAVAPGAAPTADGRGLVLGLGGGF